MSRSRFVLALALTSLVAVAPPSFAAKRPPAPKKVCDPVKDGPGDAGYPADGAPSADSLDIVKGQIASDLTRLTLWYVPKGKTTEDPATGFFIAMRFAVPGAPTNNYLGVRFDPVQNFQAAPTFEWGNWSPTTGYASQSNSSDVVWGSYSTSTHEIHITMKLAALGVKVVKGTPISKLAIETRAYPLPYLGQGLARTIDTAESTAVYGLGNPSCIKVGT
jgi:hypothetical protein